jgi:hypothetical protein
MCIIFYTIYSFDYLNVSVMYMTLETLKKIRSKSLSKSAYRLSVKSKTKTRKYNKLTKYLKMICSDSGECFAIGSNEKNKIKKIFENYENFKFAYQFAKRVGQTSVNGFVYEISYSKNGYQSNSLLKSSVKVDSDNLYYEYLVGMSYINKMNNMFPCFTETYHILRNSSDKLKKEMMKNKVIAMSEIESEYEFVTIDEKINIRDSCTKSDQLAILVQYLKNPSTINDYLDAPEEDFTDTELGQLLYQIYGPLSALGSNFTHYDLHLGNVLFYKLKEKTYITMKYVYKDQSLSFNTKYIAKIIDYGRTYFHADMNNNSKTILKKVCDEPMCNDDDEICGDEAGYQWMIPPSKEDIQSGHFEKNGFICSSIPNISHDLLFAKHLKNRVNGPVNDILNKIHYTGQFGTKELTSNSSSSKINNVLDMEVELRDYIQHDSEFKGRNQQLYDDDEYIGCLTIYMDDEKNMVFSSNKSTKKNFKV